MKKLTIISVLAVAMVSAVSGQKINASKVPAAVKAAFAKQYPVNTVKWEKEDGKYEAGFKQAGSEMSVLYNTDGTTMESEMAIKVSDLPSTVLTYIKEHYKGKSIKEAAKITKANGTVNYEAEIDGKDIIFDSAGNFLKAVKD
jgi:hypothetical protein